MREVNLLKKCDFFYVIEFQGAFSDLRVLGLEASFKGSQDSRDSFTGIKELRKSSNRFFMSLDSIKTE